MQQRRSECPYPTRRMPGPPVLWRARPDATLDDPPLPRLPATIERTRRIREVFLRDLGGCATILQVGDRCDDLGLLDGFSTHQSAYVSLKEALRPICLPNQPGGPFPVTPGSAWR